MGVMRSPVRSRCRQLRRVADVTGRIAWTRNPPPVAGPAVRVPPRAVTRSRMPISPWPPPSAGPVRASAPPAVVQDGDLGGLPHAYHADLGLRAGARVLVHVGQGFLDDPVGGEVHGGGQRRCRGSGCAATSTGRPGVAEARRRSSSRTREARGRVRWAPSGSPDWRSSPTVARSSSSAWRLASRTWASASLAWSGRLSMTWAATPAWTLTRAMWWATTSCRSRAMRRRSSATRRRASSSRVRSARSARSLMASMNARRLRTASPAAAASPVQARMPRFSWRTRGSVPRASRPRSARPWSQAGPPGGGAVGAGGDGVQRDDRAHHDRGPGGSIRTNSTA